MSNYLKHKEYLGTVEYSTEDEVFYGKLFGINDLVTFEGASVKEIKNAFEEAVEDYISTCAALNKKPEKTFKGSFNVRLPTELHKDAAFIAAQKNVSLNDFVKGAIEYAVRHKEEVSREVLPGNH
ncbi:type II toxin-antitoxin system HicB family antitoxin [Daejeonella sp. JGW-45]|uniref:type II toxin-antitoxin system HicB family antitoxin n=1 Tax=Daejeonella sp. JGW-45 TaxID=3034148 RepID=UPI0023ED24E5|nr:type II toxin-antitoxin system HicB family antitoxin [Daejeonella sp. JGW-45]